MSNDRWRATYDAWKTREPVEMPYCDDPECICTEARRHRWCPVHGLDPDDEMVKHRERQWDREER